jgi:hypothetical protein
MKTLIFLFALVMSSHAMAKKNQLVCCHENLGGGNYQYLITPWGQCNAETEQDVESYSSPCPVPPKKGK